MMATVRKRQLEQAEPNVRLLRILRRKWFERLFRPEEAKYVVPLLLEVYLAAELGEPLSKKTAMAAMGADDIKTARKYISMAERDGYLTASRAPEDRRRELLHPSDLLRDLIEAELRDVNAEVRAALEVPAQEPLVGPEDNPRHTHGGRAHSLKDRPIRPPAYLERFGNVISIIDRLPANDTFPDEEPGTGLLSQEESLKIAARQQRELDNATVDIDAYPDSAELYLRRALKHDALGNVTEALHDLQRAVQHGSPKSDYLDWKAYFHCRQRDFASAIADYSEILKRRPPDARVLSNRGLCFLRMGAYDEAIADLSRSIELQPIAVAFFLRSQAYGRQGDFQAAITDCTKVLEFDGWRFEAFMHRGACFHELGDYDLSVLDFSDAIQQKANSAEAWNGRALAYLAMKDHAHALSDADTAVELNEHSSDVRATRGEVLLAMGRYEDAMKDIEYALLRDPESHRYNELLKAAQSFNHRAPGIS